MSKQDRNTAFTIIIVLVVCTLSLVVVGASLWRIIGPGLEAALVFVGLKVKVSTSNYNFVVPARDEVAQNNPSPAPQPQPAPQPTPAPNPQPNPVPPPVSAGSDEDLSYVYPTLDPYAEPNPFKIVPANYSYNFPVPPRQETGEDSSLGIFQDAILTDAQLAGYGQGQGVNSDLFFEVPKIGIKSPVWQGLGSEALLKKGFWVYPGSHPLGQGEMVLLCHRRYFGPYDPRTCWNLDKIVVGDSMAIRKGQQTLNYTVISTAVVDPESAAVYTISDTENFLKIVTCTPLYSNAKRLVVVAKLVE